MLTINKQKIARGLEATITITPEMDQPRLGRLAAVFYGHLAADQYIFTEARGKKCWELYQAGFDSIGQSAKADRHCIKHPDIPRVLRVAEALDLVGVVTAKAAK